MPICANNVNFADYKFYINGKEVQQCDQTKYLGIILDKNLTFSSHASNVVANGNSKLYCLRKLKGTLSDTTLCKVYSSTIEPAIDYLSTIWGHVSVGNINKAQRVQNMAARIITGTFDFINVRGLEVVNDLGWNDFQARTQYNTAVLTHKAIHGFVPEHISNLILFEFETHNYMTRGYINNDLATPFIKKEKFRQSFQCNSAMVWNNLTNELKDTTDLNYFKKLYKRTYF